MNENEMTNIKVLHGFNLCYANTWKFLSMGGAWEDWLKGRAIILSVVTKERKAAESKYSRHFE